MGQIAEEMTTGVSCEMCGEYLMCEACEDLGIPAYCSIGCAKDRGAPLELVCSHDGSEET
jgi:hypothetical protein